MSHRTGNTKDFDNRWRAQRKRNKAAKASSRSNRKGK